MRKVLIVLPSMTTSGISKIVSDYIKNIKNDEIKIDLMVLNKEDDIYFKNLNNRIYLVGKSKNFIKRLYKEIAIMKKGKYDVVHVNSDTYSRLIECLAAKKSGVKKIILHSHSSGPVRKNSFFRIILIKFLKELFYFFTTDYYACSDEAAKWLFPKRIYARNKYKIINNGIEVDKFKYDEIIRKNVRKELKIKSKTFVIGFVGRLVEIKNPLFLIDLLSEYTKINSNSLLLIIGTGELLDAMKDKIKKLNLDNNVIFLGSVSEVYKYYNAMDCFVLPSKFEGLGTVNIEAQTNGLPTIVSDRVPLKAKISNLITFISLNKSAGEWVKIINKVVNNKNSRLNAYIHTIDNNYDIKSVAKELEQAYLED